MSYRCPNRAAYNNDSMRRILTIALLLAFGSPMVAPVFAATADPEASLPACCRSHGVHHCAMMHMRSAAADPAFQAPPCPFYPTALALVQVANAFLCSSPNLSAAYSRDRTSLIAAPCRAATVFTVSSNLKRGPPNPLT